MSTRCWRVKPSEVERVLKSVQKAGLPVKTIEVAGDGRIAITVGKPDDETKRTNVNPWDEVLRTDDQN